MNQREVAWRLFAEEYNSSLLEHTAEGEKPVSYIITPLGAKANRMFVVGVVTDVEDVGEEGKPRYRARLTDPTGTFYISAGEYQPAAAMALSRISPPAFAAVVGKTRAYSPQEGVKYLSIRPEQIREVDAEARDFWIWETAKSTLRRIDAVGDAMEMSQPTVGELVKLGYPENLSDGVVRALEYYKDVDLGRFRTAVREALMTIVPEKFTGMAGERAKAGPVPTRPASKEEKARDAGTREEELQEVSVGADEEDTVLKMIDSLSSDAKGVPWDSLVEACKAKKIDKVRLEEIIASLLDKGEIYEPELGIMKRI